MNWRYQLMKHVEKDGTVWYGIHEFFPTECEGGWSEDPVQVEGDSIPDIRWQLKAILNDLDNYGVVDYD